MVQSFICKFNGPKRIRVGYAIVVESFGRVGTCYDENCNHDSIGYTQQFVAFQLAKKASEHLLCLQALIVDARGRSCAYYGCKRNIFLGVAKCIYSTVRLIINDPGNIPLTGASYIC